MNVDQFLDTNVLVYAYDLKAPKHRAIALQLVKNAWDNFGQTAVSVQVLQELYVNLVRHGLSQADANHVVLDYATWPVVENTVELLKAALTEQARWQLSLWDSLILAAAKNSGATVLLTEDFSHGQDYGGVRAINPFK
jgi:predicted nucleic acid-binding protein